MRTLLRRLEHRVILSIVVFAGPAYMVLREVPLAAQAVTFPPRDQALDFRRQLEVAYRDVLKRVPLASAVDLEGSIVWTQEYLRYRASGCGGQEATSRVVAQILCGPVQPVCTAARLAFPPRNESLAFRQTLEGVYRDMLRRSPVQTFVDVEGDIVWTQEYFRYRTGACDADTATARVLDQVRGGPALGNLRSVDDVAGITAIDRRVLRPCRCRRRRRPDRLVRSSRTGQRSDAAGDRGTIGDDWRRASSDADGIAAR